MKRSLYTTISMQPSHEQAVIIHHIQEKRNVMVDAVAGSGKSTTVLMTARSCPDFRVLQLTYNAPLRKEVQEKIDNQVPPLTNVVVHTFHSYAVHNYNPSAYTDTKLKRVIEEKAEPLHSLSPVDLLILDEVQDMTPLYFQFVAKVLRDLSTRPLMMILGDTKQSLYEYKGADVRFLTEASIIWQPCRQIAFPDRFEACSLQTSFRITNQMADFVNKVMLGTTRLLATKEGPPVHYIVGSEEDNQKRIYGRILAILEDKGVQPDDIFILAPSIKNKNVRKLENQLVEKGVPCFVAREDEELLDERIIRGKIVFSSFHSSKGRQRPYVFVLGFDTSSLYKREPEECAECPNTLYVACTRASQQLFVLETIRRGNRQLPFLTMGHHEIKAQPYIHFIGEPRTPEFYSRQDAATYEEKPFPAGSVDPLTSTSCREFPNPVPTVVDWEEKVIRPSELPTHHSNEVYEELSQIVEQCFDKIQDKADFPLHVKTVIETENDRHEDVSELNGIVVPLLFCRFLEELDPTRSYTSFRSLLFRLSQEILEKETYPSEYKYLKNRVRYDMPPSCSSTEDYLLSANFYAAVKERLYGKVMQIKSYSWFPPEVRRETNQRMLATVGPHLDHIEYNLVPKEDEELHARINRRIHKLTDDQLPFRFRFAGRVDALTSSTLWEFKFVAELSLEHYLQVMVYAWIWKEVHPDKPKHIRLFNIRTNEMQECRADPKTLDRVMRILMLGRYGDKEKQQNEAFVQRCHEEFATESDIFGRTI